MTNEELVPVNNQELTTWDFEQMKSELQTLVDSYTNIAYTEDSIKDAKKDKASLNKIKKQIEDARKAFKKKCMEPYDAVEPKIKELVEMVDRQTVLISEVVKEVEDREKAKKEQEIRAYYDVKATVFGSLADSLYPKILNPKWLNKSTNKAKYQEEMLEAIAKTKSDLDVIQTMNPLMKDELEAVYVETLSMEEVEKKLEEFTDLFPNNQYVVSSRPHRTYSTYSRFTILQIRPFTKPQGVSVTTVFSSSWSNLPNRRSAFS